MSDRVAAMLVPAFGGPEALVAGHVACPAPGAAEVAIAVAAAGVNYADLLVIAGRYQVLPPRPFVPGKEVAGTVVAVGPGVTGLACGDRVMAQLEHGGYAVRVVAPAAVTWCIPDTLDFPRAAAMGLAYQTAHFALVARGGFCAGESVLVTGASGGVGLAAIQLVAALGGTAIAAVRRPEAAMAARAHGAAHVVDLSVPDLRDSLRAQVRAAVGPAGVDVVLDMVGGDVFEAALRTLAWSGRLVVVGFAGGGIPAVKANYLLVRNIAVSGLQWSDYRDRDPAWVTRVQHELLRLLAGRRIDPVVAGCYPLHDAPAALRRLAAGSVQGKLVLTPGEA